MKYINLILFLLISTFIFPNDISRKELFSNVSNFYIQGSATINFIQGSKEEISIKGKEEIVNDVTVKTNEKKLEIIIPKKSYILLKDRIVINITIKEFKEFAFDGSGKVNINDFNFDEFYLKINGSGKVYLDDSNFNVLKVDVNGNGNVNISGKTDVLKATLDGVGSIKAFKLQANDATVTLNGAGKMEINVKKELSATLNGVGELLYKGNPKLNQISLKGFGSIKNAK